MDTGSSSGAKAGVASDATTSGATSRHPETWAGKLPGDSVIALHVHSLMLVLVSKIWMSWSLGLRNLRHVTTEDTSSQPIIRGIVLAPGGLRTFGDAVSVDPATAVELPNWKPEPAGLKPLAEGHEPPRNTAHRTASSPRTPSREGSFPRFIR